MAMSQQERTKRYRTRHAARLRKRTREYMRARRKAGLETKHSDLTPEQLAKRRASVNRSAAKRSASGKTRDHYLRVTYGITLADEKAMLASQGGRCAICRTDKWGGNYNKPHVDHCHKTGKVRGLLCNACNVGLGKFGDDPEMLGAAQRYLYGGL